MKKIIIDGNKFSNLEEFYTEIDNLLTKDLTWKTGHNLDAFNDILRGGFGVHDYGEELEILWINSEKSKKDLGYAETVKHYEKVLKRCHPSNKQFVEEKLNNSREERGETIFDIIVDIITDTNNSVHYCRLTFED